MKRLICCLDGTWDEPEDETTLTNVVKLHRAIPPVSPDGTRQLAHYEIGIATSSSGAASFVSGALGLEVGLRVKSAYRFIAEAYEPGDEIYAFGFSRGAFEARSLAGLIAFAGIAKRITNQVGGAASLDSAISDAWQLYRQPVAVRPQGAIERLRSDFHYPAQIRCVGVWDTVGNLGVPVEGARINDLFQFHDTSLSPRIDVALQALAIDEPRSTFSPTLWTLPRGAGLAPGQSVEQAWFAGSHGNVGGGLVDSGLSDIALLWMAERAATLAGLHIDMDGMRVTARPDPLGEAYCPTESGIFKIAGFAPFIRLIGQDMRGLSLFRRLTGWRVARLPDDVVAINERVHESVAARIGKSVAVRTEKGVSQQTYHPATVARP